LAYPTVLSSRPKLSGQNLTIDCHFTLPNTGIDQARNRLYACQTVVSIIAI
jgi:hypothetical protein